MPVHELVDRATRVDPTIAAFDARALALAAFDAIIARQGFADRARPDALVALLARIAAVQAPQAEPAACEAVAEPGA